MRNKYSVIIPTLWKSKKILENVSNFSKEKSVSEVIVISNTTGKPTLFKSVNNIDKTKIIHNGENNFVNESWNIGYREAKNKNICISNDDITFDTSRAFRCLSKIDLKNYGIVGAPKINSLGIKSTKLVQCKKMPIDYGCLFFIHEFNYVEIPSCIKIWFGDVWLFKNCENRYVLEGINLKGEKSTTSDSFRSEFWYSDHWAWKRKVKPALESSHTVELAMRKVKAHYQYIRYKMGLGQWMRSALKRFLRR
jgi:hypothetical protein